MARIVLASVLFTVVVLANLTLWGGLVGYEYDRYCSNPEYRMSKHAYIRTVLVTVGTGAMIAVCTVGLVLLAQGH
jgi:hypothetical protein